MNRGWAWWAWQRSNQSLGACTCSQTAGAGSTSFASPGKRPGTALAHTQRQQRPSMRHVNHYQKRWPER